MKSQNVESAQIKKTIVENMKREISLMREVLSNMHQEEKALMIFDRARWNQTLQDRFPLVQTLSQLREERRVKIEQIKTGQNMPIEKLLPTADEDSCQIMNLSDQLLTLIEKTNLQFMKNERLMKDYLLHEGSRTYPLYMEDPYRQVQKKNVKATIATYPLEKP